MTDDTADQTTSTRRRGFLALCGAAAVAGCASGSERSTPSESRRSTGGPTETREATETREPTESVTQSPTETLDLGSPGAWPMAGYDTRNTGYNPGADGPTTAPSDGWRQDVDGYNTMAAGAFHDDQLFLGSGNEAYGFDPQDGFADWTVDLEYLPHFTAPAVAEIGGEVTNFLATRSRQGAIRGGGEGRLLALAPSGERRWTFDAPLSGSATPVDDRVYVPATTRERGRLHALDAADGGTVWRHEPTATAPRTPVFAAPAVTDDAVYLPVTRVDGETARAELQVLAADDGQLRRRSPTLPGEFRARPVVDTDGTAYVATRAGAVAAVDDGVAWQTGLDGEIWSTPALVDDTLYVLVDKRLVALDTGNGSQRWETTLPPLRGSELATDGETVFVGGNKLIAVATADGSQRWREPIPGGNAGGWGSPIVVGSALAVGVCVKNGDNGGLYDDKMSLRV